MYRMLAAACAVLCFVCVGCGESGPPVGTVTGQVTLDGKPHPNALVTFTLKDGGGTATGISDANGNYELIFGERKGAPVGMHMVSVTTMPQSTQTDYPGATSSSSSEDYEKQALGGGADYTAKPTEPIPAKYNTKTTLEKEVKSGSNTINLELTSS